MTKSKIYRVVCPELDVVLSVRSLEASAEKTLYYKLRDMVSSEKPIRVEEYKTAVVRSFLVDPEATLGILGDDIEDAIEVVGYAYESIISLFPAFSLEFVCGDLNAEEFFTKNKSTELLDKLLGKTSNKKEQASLTLSSIEELLALQQYFEDRIIGQEAAIKALMRALKLMASGLTQHSSFLFVGPTGVGKTQIGKLLGEKFSGNFYKVNCAEYAGGHEYAKLIGSPPGYVGHSEKSLLAEKAEKSNAWVFLFDEIEKAHHKLYDFLLSLLDDGTCTDNLGQVLDFSQSIFIFTSNQGMKEVKRESVGFGARQEQKPEMTDEVIRASVKRHFSPEFLNRIDDIVVFRSLTSSAVREIARLQLEDLPIKITKPLVDFVAKGGYSEEYGARNIARFIKNNVSDKVADAILNRLVPKKDEEYYTPRIVNGKVKIVDTKEYDGNLEENAQA